MKYRVYAGNGTRLIVSLIAGLVCFINGLVAIFLIDKKYGATGIGIVFIVIGSIFLVYVIIELLKYRFEKNKNKKKYEAQKANQLVREKAYNMLLGILPNDNHFSKMSKTQTDALKASFKQDNKQCLQYFMKYPSRDVLEFIHSVNIKAARDIAAAVLVAANESKKTNSL